MSGFQQLPAGSYIPNKGKIAAGNRQALAVVAECQVEASFTAAQGAKKLSMHRIKKRDHTLRR